ncbi:class I adenylate-forming enzyme family protein [Brachyspira pilosicoli]|uniref:Putative acyl-CoA synthase n=1 Tax=Brachyspira pilosicoli (strain ATCC BAA-1826 / 95/1000) TaxID=759914 RepID=D8IBW6_BRAP9|nr:class I adenylate-forming enzyme family protein [Brachyspira pilosicoli]ADK30639.1 putative acyl-CoA synthase [Brachyspira pilosicoli 95/1000]
MISGESFWDDNIKRDMDYISIGDRKVYTYKEAPNSMYDILLDSADKYRDKIAIVDSSGNEYSYIQLLNLVDEFACYLNKSIGIGRANKVGILLSNRVEFCISIMALSKLSSISVIFPSKYKASEVKSLYEKICIDCLIIEDIYLDYFSDEDKLQKVVCGSNNNYGFSYIYEDNFLFCNEDIISRDLYNDAIIMFTSGTTSKSKAVLLKNYNLVHAIISYNRILSITENDISIIATPIYHITGIIALFGLFIYSGGLLFLKKTFNAKEVLDTVLEKKITFIHASPTVFALLIELMDSFPSLPSLRSFACGSSNMTPNNILKIKEWLPQVDFHTVYGLTETSSPGTIFPIGAADSKYIGSSGLAIPGFDIKITDEDFNECNVGEIGEICVRGAVVLERYYNLESDSIVDGWLKTGDIGYLNDDGYLYVVDRKKDLINKGGEKICSFDVENEISKIEGVLESAVVARLDDKYGEVPVAMVKLMSGYSYSYEDFYNILIKNLAKYKVPVDIIFTDELPKTANGKVDKKEIKKIFNK